MDRGQPLSGLCRGATQRRRDVPDREDGLIVDSMFLMEQQRAAYGDNPYVHGFGPNRAVIETFLRYAHEQGYVARPMRAEELFVPETLGL